MQALIKFYVKRKFKEKVTLILNILISVVIIVCCQIDLIFSISLNKECCIKLDDTTAYLYNYISQDDVNYIISNTKEGNILHYDEGFTLVADSSFSNEKVNAVKEDIKEALYKYYLSNADIKTQYYLDKIYQDIDIEIASVDTNNSLVSLVLSVVYFLLLSYGNIIGQDIVFEKKSRILELQLTCIEAKEHFKAKIISGYVSLLIQLGIILISFLVGIGIRYKIDQFQGLTALMSDGGANLVTIQWQNVILIAGLIILGVITIQIIMLVVSSIATNADQAAALSSLFYIVLLVIYYYLLSNNNISFFSNSLIYYLAFVPIINIFIAPAIFIYQLISVKEIIISMVISIVFFYLLIQLALPIYKKNILKN